MKKNFFSLEEVTLPIETLMDESLMLVKGGGVRGVDPTPGKGCGCGCTSGTGCGCDCVGGGAGCGCTGGAGCGCGC